MEPDEPRLTMLPEDGFTERGRAKCLTLYKNLIQQVCDFGGPVLGGLGETGVQTWTARQPEHCAQNLTQ